MSIFRDFGKAARGNAAPVTTALVVAIVAAFLLLWTRTLPLTFASALIFDTREAFVKPWTFLTYPFVTGAMTGPVGVILLCWWLWFVGGAVERDLGSSKFLAAWCVISVLCAFCVLLGALILQLPGSSTGAWTCVAALTVMWGTRNPTATILIMFIIPISGKWMAWLSAALVFFQTQPPQLAPFAALPLLLAYLFAANKLPVSYSRHDRRYTAPAKKTERYDKKYYEEVRRREQDRNERERLRKLFESSVNEDEK